MPMARRDREITRECPRVQLSRHQMKKLMVRTSFCDIPDRDVDLIDQIY